LLPQPELSRQNFLGPKSLSFYLKQYSFCNYLFTYIYMLVNPRDGADASRNETNEILPVYLLNLLSFIPYRDGSGKMTVGSTIIGSQIRSMNRIGNYWANEYFKENT